MQISSWSNGSWGVQEDFNLTAHLKRKTESAPHKQTPMQAIAAQMAAEEAKKNEPAPSIAGVSELMSRNFTEAAQEAPAPLSVHWKQPETGGAPQAEPPGLMDALKMDDAHKQTPLEAMQEELEQAAQEALATPAEEGGVLAARPMGSVAQAPRVAQAYATAAVPTAASTQETVTAIA